MNKDISTIVKSRRESIGMSKRVLSEKSGVSRATILLVEERGVQPMFSNGVAMLESMGLEVIIRPKKRHHA